MKKIKFLVLILLITCCSCTQCISTDMALVKRVERYNEGYNVYLESLNKIDDLCHNSIGIPEDIYFRTKNPTYHVGDTVKFVNKK